MINLSPVWVISLLPENEFSQFQLIVNNQFLAFTKKELDSDINTSPASKWWGIDQISLDSYEVDSIINTVPNSLKQAYTGTSDSIFIQNKLTIVLYGMISKLDSQKINELIGKLKSKLPPSFTIMYYGLFFDRKINIKTDQVSNIFSDIKLDAVILQCECNQNQNNNDGYLNLFGELHNDLEKVFVLGTQILLNLAVGHGFLYSKINEYQKVFVAGGFSITHEDEVRKSVVAKKYLTIPIISDFIINDKDKFWYNIHELPDNFISGRKEINTKNFYDRAILLFDDQFNELKGFFSHQISPWALFSSLLIPRYFAGELKLVLQHLVDYSRLVDLKLFSRFEKHLRQNIEGDSGLKAFMLNKIHELALSLWSDCNVENKTPIGLKQFENNLKLILADLIEIKRQLNNDSEFHKISSQNEPLKVNQLIYDEYKSISSTYYKQTIQSDLNLSENESEEFNYLNRLKKKLLIHAIPLSLMVRSFILGLVFSVSSFGIAKIFSSTFLKDNTDVIVWLSVTFAIPILIALFHYGILTLKKIRKLKKEYLAWVFFRIQCRLIKESRDHINFVIDYLVMECERILGNLSCFINYNEPGENKANNETIENNLALKLRELISAKSYEYPSNYFQQSIFDPIDQTSALSFVDDLHDSNYYIEIQDNEFSLVDLSQDILYQVFAQSFIKERNYKYFFDNVLLENKLNLTDFANIKHQQMEKIVMTHYLLFNHYQLTEHALNIIQSRAHPSLYNYASEDLTKFLFVIGNQEHLPRNIETIIDGEIVSSSSFLPIDSTEPHDVKLKGIIQICKYYRLSKKEDIPIIWDLTESQQQIIENN